MKIVKYVLSTLTVLITFIVLQFLSVYLLPELFLANNSDWTSVAALTLDSPNQSYYLDYLQLFFVFLSTIVGFIILKLVEKKRKV
ncbi:hypothetical protein CON64_18165 [Bacillus pseudomycoides]|nr:hypothetical protein CON64_18165 [Bacillus pseudomycoides]